MVDEKISLVEKIQEIEKLVQTHESLDVHDEISTLLSNNGANSQRYHKEIFSNLTDDSFTLDLMDKEIGFQFSGRLDEKENFPSMVNPHL